MYSDELQKGVSPSQMSDEQLVQLMDSSLKEKYDTLTLSKKRAFLEDYRTFLEEQPPSPAEDVSGAATAYLFLLPLLVFGVLEVLRSLVLAPLTGLGSSVMT